MLKKTLWALVLLFFCTQTVNAQADSLPSDILVTQRDGDRPVTTGTVELCRVGEILEDGFLLGEEFGGGFIALEDVPSPEFAFWMSRKAGVGLVEPVNSRGMVRYPAAEPGLYLIRQRQPAEGYYGFRPYLVTVTGEMTLVDTYPVMERLADNPRTKEPKEPYLAALGVAVTFTGFLFWDEARRRESGERGLK